MKRQPARAEHRVAAGVPTYGHSASIWCACGPVAGCRSCNLPLPCKCALHVGDVVPLVFLHSYFGRPVPMAGRSR